MTVNPANQTAEEYHAGLSWAPAPGVSVGVKHESLNKLNLELGRFLLYFNHVASSTNTIGTEFALNWATRVVTARTAILHRFNDDTSAKVRVNQDGNLDLALKHRVNANVTAGVVANLSALQIAHEQRVLQTPLGFSLDLKF